ncbi:Xaa-Pro aminopeptidase [Malassezia vespertilionis]|uniref:Xaa-Pro aminopeptidase n=1 Tax=Malassezia vespertilionis TaxID=2020962 RepID=UPI0024B0B638|nr:Xaa-Pro aminopeptidase [Malassezia vespertilionis]WFD06742.1 Xaa-Pro aminopeptidase [Malassezia vespertilionis]
MLRRATIGSKKRRAHIRHENTELGAGAGVTEGPIMVPGHNAFPAQEHASRNAKAHARVSEDMPHTARGGYVQPAPVQSAPLYGMQDPPASAPMTTPYTHAGPMDSMGSPSPIRHAQGPPIAHAQAPQEVQIPSLEMRVPPNHATPERSTNTPTQYLNSPQHTSVRNVPSVETTPTPMLVSSRVSPQPPLQAATPTPKERRNPSSIQDRPVGSLTYERQPAALGAALSALSFASRKRQTERILRGGTRQLETNTIMTPAPGLEPAKYVNASDEPAFRDLNAVLRKLKAEWGFLLGERFNPVQLALTLLPGAPLRARQSEFSGLNSLIETTLQGTLDDHYESFATAITLNYGVANSLGDAQTNITSARQKLRSARDTLGARRADLVQMWQRIQSIKEAMRVLGLIEQLRSVPDELESLMSAKNFLDATQLLMRSLRLIQREDLSEVGATADLRAYLRSQEHSLLEILIEELHNHLYLKSYYCDARWKSYTPGQETLPDPMFGTEYTLGADVGATRPIKLARFLSFLRGKIVHHQPENDTLLDRPCDAEAEDAPETIGLESSQSPENDSFLYIETLLQSLARLGKIGYALEIIAQRLPLEIHQLVDTTIDEVDLRHDPHRHTMRSTAAAESALFSAALTTSFLEDGSSRKSFSLLSAAQLSEARGGRFSQPEHSALQRDMETMRDFFWTLFSKLDAVLQSYRVIQEVASLIFSQAGLKGVAAAERVDTELGIPAFAHVWQTIEHEVSALLRDYLSEDSQDVKNAAQFAPPVNAVLRAQRYERDRTQSIFRIADARKLSKEVHSMEQTVDAALQRFVPGLMTQDAQPSVATDAPRYEDESSTGHRLLVRPLTFTASVLFQPTLSFIQRVQLILPRDADKTSHDFGGFLRIFVQDLFLPMLEEKVHAITAKASSAPEAFTPEPMRKTHTVRPVVRSATQIVALVDSLYTMLQAAPLHRASYSRLILLTFVEYYAQCNARFKKLVSKDMDAEHTSGPYMTAAIWAQKSDLYTSLDELIQLDPADLRALELKTHQVVLEREYAQGQPICRADLITSRKRHAALANLQYSIYWLLAHISQLRVTDADDVRANVDNKQLALPLHADLIARSEEIPKQFLLLSRVVLMTLREELHLKTLHYLHLAVTEGTYVVDGLSHEPDSHVVALNTELSACNEVYKETLLPEHQAFLFDGLDKLMDAMMVSAVTSTGAVNHHGVIKMIRNILSLQQNLKNILAVPQTVDLERSKRLWEMVSREPEQWVAALHRTGPTHSFDEYRAALDLCLGLARSPDQGQPGKPMTRLPNAGTTAEPETTQQRYNEYLIELHEVAGVPM